MTPLNDSYLQFKYNDEADDVKKLLKWMLEVALKDNKYIEKALVTGIFSYLIYFLIFIYYKKKMQIIIIIIK